MDESNKSEGQTPLPAQQAQQPQPTTALNDHQIQTPQMHSVSDASRRNSKGGPTNSGKGSGGEPKSDGGDSQSDGSDGGASLDEARFAAGVVKLYETLLKEAIPEEMLRLVDQLGKQERK